MRKNVRRGGTAGSQDMRTSAPATHLVRAYFAYLTIAAGCGQGVSLDPSHPAGGAGSGGGNQPPFQAGPCGQLGTGGALAIAFSPDGVLVAAAYGSGAVTLYNAADGSVARHLRGHDVSADALAFTPDGSLLVTGGGDGLVKAWHVSDGSLVWMGVGDHLDSVTSVAVSADGTLVASTGIEGVMTVWHADGGQVWSQKVQDSQFNVLFTADSASVISHSNQPLVQYHRVSDGQVVKELVLADAVRLDAVSTDGSLLLGVHDSPTRQGETVAAYRVSDGSVAWQIQSPHTDIISGLARSGDGSTLATTSRDGTVKLWRSIDGGALRTIAASGPGASVALSADGSSVVGGTFAGDLVTYRVSNGAPLATVAAPPGHAGTVFQVSFSPDGNFLASVALSNGDEDHGAKIWRVNDGSLLRTIPDAGAQTTQALAFSPDSGFVAVALPSDGLAGC